MDKLPPHAPAFAFDRADLATVAHAGTTYPAGFLAPDEWGQLPAGFLVFVRLGTARQRGPLLAGRVLGNELAAAGPLRLDVLAAGATVSPPAPAVCELGREEIRGIYLALGEPQPALAR